MTDALDAATWLDAARDHASSSRFDEAAHAALNAHVLGAAASAVLELLSPSLEDLELRSISLREHDVADARPAAWSADGRALYFIESNARRHAIHAWDPLSGEVRLVFAPAETERGALGSSIDPGAPRVRAVAPDLRGTHLALAFERRTPTERGASEVTTSVAILELASGELGAPIITANGTTAAKIAFTGLPGWLIVASEDEVLARKLLASGASSGKTVVTRLRRSSLDAAGAAVGLVGRDDRIARYEPGANAPAFEVALPRARDERREVLAARERSLVVGTELVLLDAKGAVVWRRPAPPELAQYPRAALSPSARLLAFARGAVGGDGLVLLDLATGASRSFPSEAMPMRGAWAPSGRRLSIDARPGTAALTVLQVRGECERSHPSPPATMRVAEAPPLAAREVGKPGLSPVVAGAFDSDGRLFTTHADSKLRRWDLARGRTSVAFDCPGGLIAIDPTGRWLASGSGREVRVFSLEDSMLAGERVVSGGEILGMALTGAPGHVLVCNTVARRSERERRVRALPVSAAGAIAAKAAWSIAAPELSLDPSGAVAARDAKGGLELHDSLGDGPRVRLAVDAPCQVFAAGRRAIVVSDRVSLVSEEGSLVASVALPREIALGRKHLFAVAAATGSFVVLLRYDLERPLLTAHAVDLEAGTIRPVAIGDATLAHARAACSKSGAVALFTDRGTVLLVER